MKFYPLKDWESLYEINRNGIVRSLPRQTTGTSGAIQSFVVPKK